MGWWPFKKGSSSNTDTGDVAQNTSDAASTDHPIFLEDVQGKFQDIPTMERARIEQHGTSYAAEVKNQLKSITLEDFHMSNLVTIPCFRDAGLAGFSCFFVFSSVLFFYHNSLRKAVNWGFGGLLLGSIFGWEHCNNQRRQSQMAVRLAQERFEAKGRRNQS
ncbi:hypothetical protein CANINC_002508 [Pichia inconspicua]|uniref:Cytochrome c oxidase assembly protein COX20, mitochondrial n=1 Tax=Pichia inconspicua TaxID=52247 RepID=A0A4T0X1A0_9ASCO|nr:hypothetical protein CANINC_002508 [[Candida] inconspicua]